MCPGQRGLKPAFSRVRRRKKRLRCRAVFATLNERPPPLLTPHPGARGVPAEGSRSAATVREEDGAVVPKKLLPAVYQTQRFVTHFFDEARLSKNRQPRVLARIPPHFIFHTLLLFSYHTAARTKTANSTVVSASIIKPPYLSNSMLSMRLRYRRRAAVPPSTGAPHSGVASLAQIHHFSRPLCEMAEILN